MVAEVGTQIADCRFGGSDGGWLRRDGGWFFQDFEKWFLGDCRCQILDCRFGGELKGGGGWWFQEFEKWVFGGGSWMGGEEWTETTAIRAGNAFGEGAGLVSRSLVVEVEIR